MKNYALLILAFVVAGTSLTACFDDDDTSYDDYCYISAFSLGTLKRTLWTYDADGEDSTYSASFSGTLYPMTIDQRALTIQNLDSLPTRTKLDKVLATVEFEGVLAWRKAELTAEDDTTWTTYDSSDSLDMSEPLHFAVIAGNGNSYRTYTVKVNVHQEEGDSTVWSTVEDMPAAGTKAVVWSERLGVYTSDVLTYISRPLDCNSEWVSSETTGAEGADVSTLRKTTDRLLMSTSAGQIIESTNALDWTEASYPQADGLMLVAATDEVVYALVGGQLMSSDGGDWVSQTLDESAAYLPNSQVHSFAYDMPNGTSRVMIVGSREGEDDETCEVWATTTGNDWMRYTPNAADKRRLPVMESLNVVSYDSGFLALGGATRNGVYAALDSVLYSADNGVTWVPYANDDMLIDSEMQEAAASAQTICAASDDESYFGWPSIGECGAGALTGSGG